MSGGIAREFERLEKQKRAVLNMVSGWPRNQLTARPAPSSWSALEILDHLVRVERTAIDAVIANLPKGHPVGLRDRLLGAIAKGVMRSTIRVKVPDTIAEVHPGTANDLNEIAERWSEARAEMTRLVATLSPEQLRCGLVRHPVSGWMTIEQGLSFLSAHLRHHVFQLNRVARCLARNVPIAGVSTKRDEVRS